MPSIPIDDSETPEAQAGDQSDASEPREHRRTRSQDRLDTERERTQQKREDTKQLIIEAAKEIIMVVLYMVFTMVRERESGVVVLDPEDELGPEDDWAEE